MPSQEDEEDDWDPYLLLGASLARGMTTAEGYRKNTEIWGCRQGPRARQAGRWSFGGHLAEGQPLSIHLWMDTWLVSIPWLL